MKRNPIPQTGPAIVLAQLLTEHPELQPVTWTLAQDGMLMGNAHHLDVDVRPLMAAYVQVLGGTPSDSTHTQQGRGEQFSSWLFTTWQDVPLSVTLGCPAELVSNPLSLPAAWSAAGAA